MTPILSTPTLPRVSAPKVRRRRYSKPIAVTLTDEERSILEAISQRCGDAPLSRVVAAAIVAFTNLPLGKMRAAVIDANERVPKGRPPGT